jgi:hypothetical protein
MPQGISHFFAALTRNGVSLAGAALATGSAVLITTFFVMELLGFEGSPYIGILTYLILPVLFVLGLVIIPVGVLRQRDRERKAAARGETPPGFPVIDLNQQKTRGAVLTFLVLTIVNVVILAGATYKGVEVMDSTKFCGEACHTVMEPEYTAYRRSPHARVDCADCHIGPGADWFVKSKLSGAWQLVAVTFDLYPRPIPTPLSDLRPARDTCEQCHWPTKFYGDKLTIRTHYADDEENTELKSVLMVKVGGLQGRQSSGIHWHVDPGVQIRYRSDRPREKIYDVELKKPDGTVKVFETRATPEDATGWRVMDCLDCHNRPTHTFRQPQTEVDVAIEEGLINRSLPFIKREAVRVLKARYESHDKARAGIAAELQHFYRDNYPDVLAARADAVEEAARTLGAIYAWNVFPEMRVTWDTYANHLGHTESPGCFRCHDRRHRTEDRERIEKDCSMCHSLLAESEANPAILQELKP